LVKYMHGVQNSPRESSVLGEREFLPWILAYHYFTTAMWGVNHDDSLNSWSPGIKRIISAAYLLLGKHFLTESRLYTVVMKTKSGRRNIQDNTSSKEKFKLFVSPFHL
jgi:hypothetical protein